ncbi:hypothetical protein C8R44DRAFT_885675 [Mycena epipterygia]|nr:hypothetical protein C8R44DRAFT_885675 [Mycena epipterygia]
MATPETPTTMPEPRSATPATTTGPRPPTPATMPSPPSSGFTFPHPPSPSKNPELKPNAHPYPIKTNSTGILSRSNSFQLLLLVACDAPPLRPVLARCAEPRKGGAARGVPDNMYLPSSGSTGNLNNGSGSGTGGGGVQGPRALPVPPGVSNNSIASRNAAVVGPGVALKRWTPEQLAAHLGTAVSREVGEWAARRGVGGRAFMCMSEEELAEMGDTSAPFLYPRLHPPSFISACSFPCNFHTPPLSSLFPGLPGRTESVAVFSMYACTLFPPPFAFPSCFPLPFPSSPPSSILVAYPPPIARTSPVFTLLLHTIRSLHSARLMALPPLVPPLLRRNSKSKPEYT